MSRLVVISNRIPTDAEPAGGLVFALHELLLKQGGVWIGADEPGDAPGTALRDLPSADYEKRAFPLSHDEHEAYYLGYANAVLWPICHSRLDLVRLNADWFHAYDTVNVRLAKLVARELQPGDMVWIHDYHFFPLASKLRELGVDNRIGFFLHIPFPPIAALSALPEKDQVPGWIAAYDLFGLQTQRDVASCLEYLRQQEGLEILSRGGRMKRGDRQFRVSSFPIGVDAAGFRAAAEAALPEVRNRVRSVGPLILGVDRLDYSKGLVQRVAGFGRFLDMDGAADRRPTYFQIAPVSREDVAAYQKIRKELDEIAGSVNGSHADLDWTPIRYVRRNVSREIIAGLYRLAHVGLVTPLADGMNLVAKEYIAAQDPDDPGVLVLSQFAGAAEQLTEALLVNPYDADDIARALQRAIDMPRGERVARHEAMTGAVFDQDIAWWGRMFLDRLEAAGAVERAEV